MEERKLNPRLTSLDEKHIILDIGLTHTKCGFNKEALPMHIVPTPLRLVQQVRDNIVDVSLLPIYRVVERHYPCKCF